MRMPIWLRTAIARDPDTMIIIAGLRGKRPISDGELADIAPRARARAMSESERNAPNLVIRAIRRVRTERRNLNVSYAKETTDGISAQIAQNLRSCENVLRNVVISTEKIRGKYIRKLPIQLPN